MCRSDLSRVVTWIWYDVELRVRDDLWPSVAPAGRDIDPHVVHEVGGEAQAEDGVGQLEGEVGGLGQLGGHGAVAGELLGAGPLGGVANHLAAAVRAVGHVARAVLGAVVVAGPGQHDHLDEVGVAVLRGVGPGGDGCGLLVHHQEVQLAVLVQVEEGGRDGGTRAQGEAGLDLQQQSGERLSFDWNLKLRVMGRISARAIFVALKASKNIFRSTQPKLSFSRLR